MASNRTFTVTPADRDAMIRTVIGEAGDQGDLGQAGVAHVIMNRAIGSGASPTSVVMSPNQFEPWSTRAGELRAIPTGSDQYQAAGKVVDGVLSGDIPDPTNGATGFLNPDTVMARSGRLPKWAVGNAVKIGAHVFTGGGDAPQQPSAADAPDASSAIAAAAPAAPQAGQGSVPPGLLAFSGADGRAGASSGSAAPQPAPAGTGAPSAPAPAGAGPAGMSDADLEALITGKPAAAAPSAGMTGDVSFAPAQPSAPAGAAHPATMNDADLEALITGKPAAAAPSAGMTGDVSFAPAQPSAPAGAAHPATMNDADLEALITGKGAASAAPPKALPSWATEDGGLVWGPDGGRDAKTGALIVAGSPMSDAGHWNGALNFANGALQGAGTDIMAGVGALKAKLLDDNPLPLGKLYDQAKSTYQGGQQSYAAANPLTAAGTEIGGSLSTAIPAMALGGAGISATGNALADAARGVPQLARALPAAEAAGSFVAGNAGAGGAGAANLLLRGTSLATNGAAQGAAGAAISSGLSDRPLADQVAQGAALGGAAGAVVPAVVGAGRAGINRLLGAGGVSPETAQLAQVAQQYGIPIRPGQLTDSPGVRFADSALSRTPGMGYGGEAAAQGTAFNRAVANTMGETADRITPAVMTTARTRIGAALDNVAANTTIRQDAPFVSDLTGLAQDAHGVLADSELRPLQTQIQNVLSKFSGAGEMNGDAYQALTRTGAPLDRLQSSSDSNLRYYANQVRNALDDAMERSASPDVLAQLREARGQYKAMKTIEPLVEKSTTGDVSPAGLMQAVRGSYNGMAYGGGGDLGNLARVGQRFLKEPPSSGTAERLQAGATAGKIGNTIGTLGALGGATMGAHEAAPYLSPYVSPEMILPTLAGMAGSFGAGRIASSVLRSPTVSNMLVNRALGNAAQPNSLMSAAVRNLPMLAGPVYNRLVDASRRSQQP